MTQSRNILYQIKKKAQSRSSPMCNPTDPNAQIRQELNQLRTINRNQETQLIRIRAEVSQLRSKIFFYQEQVKSNSQTSLQKNQTLMLFQQNSTYSTAIQLKQLKEQLDQTHSLNLNLNGKIRQIQAQNRQLESDLNRLKTKVKQLQILNKVRTQNFERQIEDVRPVIIENKKQYQIISSNLKKIIDFMREKVISVAFQTFLQSAKQCQNEKKQNSFSIFINCWAQILKHKHFGYQPLLQCLKSLSQLEKYLIYDKDELFDINNSTYRDTLNEWIIGVLTEIKTTKNDPKVKEQKLFRLLGLQYRSQFPIQKQKYEIDLDVKRYLQQTLCIELYSLILD